jgi:hypothetical protein
MILLHLILGFILFAAIQGFLFGNVLMRSFLKQAPLFAYTPQALITGRSPLQSGLCTSDRIL